MEANRSHSDLINALLDALTLEWNDNGNISAEATRDSCISVLCDELGKSFDEVLSIIERRITEKQ